MNIREEFDIIGQVTVSPTIGLDEELELDFVDSTSKLIIESACSGFDGTFRCVGWIKESSIHDD